MSIIFDPKYKKILLVLPDSLSADHVASSLVISQLLIQQEKNVTILVDTQKYRKQFSESFPNADSKLVDQIESKSFVSIIPKDKEVENVKVDQDDNGFRIYVKTKTGSLAQEKIKFQPDLVKFDLIVFWGLDCMQSSKVFTRSYGNSIAKSVTLNVSYIENKADADIQEIQTASSICELTKIICVKHELSLTKEQATFLLAGILYNTKNLQINTTKQTVKHVYLLSNKDRADLNIANEKINRNTNPFIAKWSSLVFQNLKITPQIYYSFVQDSTIDAKIFEQLSREEKVPISKYRDCEIALVMTKIDEIIHCFLESRNFSIQAYNLVSDFEKIGDRSFVYFWTDKSQSEILETIVSKIQDIKENIPADDKQNSQLPEEKINSTSENAVVKKTDESVRLKTNKDEIIDSKEAKASFVPNAYDPLPSA